MKRNECGYIFTPLKCRAAPDATAPHTVLSFAPVNVCQWLSEGARLKLSFSWEGRGTTGSSQYSPPHSGSHLGGRWSQKQQFRVEYELTIKFYWLLIIILKARIHLQRTTLLHITSNSMHMWGRHYSHTRALLAASMSRAHIWATISNV